MSRGVYCYSLIIDIIMCYLTMIFVCVIIMICFLHLSPVIQMIIITFTVVVFQLVVSLRSVHCLSQYLNDAFSVNQNP